MSIATATTTAPQLDNWNEAREIAADLLTFFYEGRGDYAEIEARYSPSFPPRPVVVNEIMTVAGENPRRFARTDSLARAVMGWY